MKKLLTVLLVLALAAGFAGCSCNEVEEASSTPSSVVSITTPSVVSIPVVSQIGDDFVARTFEISAVTTTDWNSYKKMSEPVAARFSLWMPPQWAADSDTSYKDAAGRQVCEVLAPVYMSENQKLADNPGAENTELGEITSTVDTYLSAMHGKLVTRTVTGDDGAKSYLYEYYMTDSNITYRVNFFSYTGSQTDIDTFNAVMDRLVNGK